EAALVGNPGVAAIVPLAVAAFFYRQETPAYRGLAAHEKKIIRLIQATIDARPPEDDLARLAWLAYQLRAFKVLKTCGEQGKQRFPNNSSFEFLLGEQAIQQRPKTF